MPGQIFSVLPSRDREGVVADSFSNLSLLKNGPLALARPYFHGSIVSRRLVNNCAIFGNIPSLSLNGVRRTESARVVV